MSYGASHAQIQRGIERVCRAPLVPLTWNPLFGGELVLIADAL